MWTKEKNIIDAASWFGRKIQLINEKGAFKQKRADDIAAGRPPVERKIYRGGVYWAELGEGNIGGEKTKLRPCLVVSANFINKGDTVVVIPLSRKYPHDVKGGNKVPRYDNHYALFKSKYGALAEDSAVKCEDIRSIDMVRIRDVMFNVNPEDMKELSKRIDFVLGYRVNKKSKKG